MKCLNTRAKLIIQHLYESMFHEPYMLTEGSHAKINNNPAFMPVVIEKVGKLPGYGEVISIAHYGEQSGDLIAEWNSPSSEATITPSASATTICANTTASLKTTV